MFRTCLLTTLLMCCTLAVADDMPRTITVTGTGSASAAPDRASLRMSIVAKHPTVAEAQREAGDVVAKILSMADDLGIDRDDIDTTGSSIRADYRWNRQREEQELRGYISERQMRIEVDDIDKLGAIVEGAVEAGVNQVSPPELDSSERRDAYRRALDAAARDAHANARQLADSLNTGLGSVQQISVGSQPSRPPMPYMRMAAAADSAESGAAETYNPASLSFDATVTVVYLLD